MHFRFRIDIEFMLGSKPNLYWMVTWMIVTPLLTAAIIVGSLYELFTKGITYEGWSQSLVSRIGSQLSPFKEI